ncbi:hypothetical protein SBA4_3910005 [Candidatus Sulfopaludibacter sp. SbA4]|nr:hypothetical protein SBA4_3910005 [Candidatus Sulfopaludibacter sp. SbA4]
MEAMAAIQERTVEAMAANLSDLRAEILIRAQATERNMDRMAESLRGIQTQLMGLNRWADTLDRDTTARVAALEHQRQ